MTDGVVLDRAHERLEHEVEPARRGERAAVVGAAQTQPLDDEWIGQVGRAQVLGAGQLVEPEPPEDDDDEQEQAGGGAEDRAGGEKGPPHQRIRCLDPPITK